ncbi:MAG: CdaR family protein [Candidatus Choladocola sp.]|nr:CdaR family protein [Candidatus Choladocola sp.]
MKHKFTRNLGLKFLSLLVAFLIWLLVVNVDNPTKSILIKDVEINVINEESVTEIDKVFDIISDETVIIKVTERRSVLNSLTKEDFTVVADMENLNEMNSVPLTVTCRNPAVTLDEMEIVPSSMKVKLEQKKQSEFVVTVNTTGKPDNGFEVGRTEVVQGKTVQIAGPESILNRIGQVVANVNVAGMKTDQRVTAVLQVYDKNGDPVQMSRLQIKDSSGVLLSDNTVKVDVLLWEVMADIPVEVKTVGTPAEGYQLAGVTTIPVTVNLVGTQEALARLNGKIVLEEAISIDGATENIEEDLDITETLNNIEGLRLVADADPTISVSVQIEKKGDRTLQIPLSNLEITNKPENMILTFSPADVIPVVIHAAEGDSDIEAAAVKATIDLSDCVEPGVYEIPVEIELPEGYELVSDVTLMVTAEAQLQIKGDSTEGTDE